MQCLSRWRSVTSRCQANHSGTFGVDCACQNHASVLACAAVPIPPSNRMTASPTSCAPLNRAYLVLAIPPPHIKQLVCRGLNCPARSRRVRDVLVCVCFQCRFVPRKIRHSCPPGHHTTPLPCCSVPDVPHVATLPHTHSHMLDCGIVPSSGTRRQDPRNSSSASSPQPCQYRGRASTSAAPSQVHPRVT